MCDRSIEISSMVFFINLVDILSNPWLHFALSFFGNMYYVRWSNWGKEKCVLSVLWHVVFKCSLRFWYIFADGFTYFCKKMY